MHEVVGHFGGEPLDELFQDGPARQILRERHRMLFDVYLAGPAVGVPPQTRVAHLSSPRPVEDRADEDGSAHCPGRTVEHGGGAGVRERVDVGGVLRPQDEVRTRGAPGRDICPEAFGRCHVVGGDLEHASECVQATGPRDVALDGRDLCRADLCGAGQRYGEPEQRHGYGGAQQAKGHATIVRSRARRPQSPEQQQAKGRGGGPLSRLDAPGSHHGCAERAQGENGGGQQRPAAGNGGGHQRGAAERRQGRQWCTPLAEGQLSPREPAERCASTQRFLADPHRGDPQRPATHASDQRRRGRHQREQGGFADREHDPAVNPDEDDKPQHRQHESEAEQHAQTGRARQRHAAYQQGDGGYRDRRQRPEPHRGECEVQRDSGRDGERRPGQAAGPGAGRTHQR